MGLFDDAWRTSVHKCSICVFKADVLEHEKHYCHKCYKKLFLEKGENNGFHRISKKSFNRGS